MCKGKDACTIFEKCHCVAYEEWKNGDKEEIENDG